MEICFCPDSVLTCELFSDWHNKLSKFHMDFYKTLELIPIGDYIFNLILIFLAPVFYVLRIFFGLESLLHMSIQNKKYIKVEILCSLKWVDLCTKDKVTYLFHRSVRADSAKLVIFF